MAVNREFVDTFVEEHGHAPWITCGDPEYACDLLNATKECDWCGRTGKQREECPLHDPPNFTCTP